MKILSDNLNKEGSIQTVPLEGVMWIEHKPSISELQKYIWIQIYSFLQLRQHYFINFHMKYLILLDILNAKMDLFLI